MPRGKTRYFDGDPVYGYKLKPYDLAREVLASICAVIRNKSCADRDKCRTCPAHFTYASALKAPIAMIISREAERIVQGGKDIHRVHRST